MSSDINSALVRVSRKIAAEGIGKTRRNQQQGYNFRGVDEVMNAFAPLLASEGIVIRPRFTERECQERASKGGGLLFSVTVKGEFDFVAEDGSALTVGPFYGEAMDSGDKATNKAMAVAFKYAMFQTFCVPLEGVTGGDADAVTHEVSAIKVSPNDGVWESLSQEDQAAMLVVAAKVSAYLADGNIGDALDHVIAHNLSTDEKAALFSRFDSKQRAALKKEHYSRKERVAA